MFRAIRLFFSFAAATAALLLCAAVSTATALPAAGASSYVLYRYGLSSEAQALIVPPENAALLKFLYGQTVTGESAVYPALNGEELAEKLGAVLRFSERAGGVTNCYYYSPQLGQGVILQGERVNLHVAIREKDGKTAVGTPLIFGGF